MFSLKQLFYCYPQAVQDEGFFKLDLQDQDQHCPHCSINHCFLGPWEV